jgi:hypothetical protein
MIANGPPHVNQERATVWLAQSAMHLPSPQMVITSRRSRHSLSK